MSPTANVSRYTVIKEVIAQGILMCMVAKLQQNF